ncbi:hypothetical protein ACA086_11360 [Muriicola sp. E247]
MVPTSGRQACIFLDYAWGVIHVGFIGFSESYKTLLVNLSAGRQVKK